MFRRWVPISFIVVAIALTLAGGAVLAAGGGDASDNSRRSDIFERAAQLLGIGTSHLEDAHDRATRELNDEKLATIVEKLVSGGLIEQSEADSFSAWMADRPEIADAALLSSLTSSAFNLRSFPLALAKLELPGLGLALDYRSFRWATAFSTEMIGNPKLAPPHSHRQHAIA